MNYRMAGGVVVTDKPTGPRPELWIGTRVSLSLRGGLVQMGTLKKVTDDAYELENRKGVRVTVPRAAVTEDGFHATPHDTGDRRAK